MLDLGFYLDKRRIYYLTLGLAAVIIIGILFAIYPENCDTDKKCFFEASQECSSAKVQLLKQGGLYEYRIHGEKGDNCLASVHLIKVSDSVQPDKKTKLNDKIMECAIPLEKMNQDLTEWEGISQYCTGPLKEAILEITLEKLYGIVVTNLGQVSMGFQDALETVPTNS